MNRDDFLMLNKDIIYLDSGATSLKPYILGEAISDYYRGTYGANWSGSNNTVMVISNNRILINNNFTSLTQFKNWLSSHNTTIYYLLATPQDIPITDNTLVNQLNNIYNNAYSYSGTTNITSTFEDGNEQMVIDASALLDLNSLITRIQILESEV